MTLSIVIPAFNEEEAIEAIIERCLAVKKSIIAKTSVREIEILIISDGSTDATVSKAEKYIPQIKLIAYPDNRGYGQALKIGFKNSKGDLLAFLDADGTCDPIYLIKLIKILEKSEADLVVGSRLGPSSRMPALRKLGNKIFRTLINLIANSQISDLASGMRVIRREKIDELYPLPDGLDFTPAMSCRAIFDPNLNIQEGEIIYKERCGKSKLKIFQDGLRFLKVILSSALLYKPFVILSPIAILLILISFLYGILTLSFYLKTGVILDGEIYRLVSIMVFGVSGILLLGLLQLTDKVTKLFLPSRQEQSSIFVAIVRWIFSWKRLWLLSPLLLASGIFLNYQTITSWVTTQKITTHWSYVVTGGYFALLGIIGFTLGVIDYLLDLLKEKLKYSLFNK